MRKLVLIVLLLLWLYFYYNFFPLKIKELGNKNICYFSQFFSFFFGSTSWVFLHPEKAPVNAWQRTESYSAADTIDFGCFLSQRAPVMRLHWLDSVVPNGLRTAGFLTGSVSGPLVLPLLKHKGDRGRCGYYLSSSQIPSISPSSKMKRRRARQRGKKTEYTYWFHLEG